jgi:hypothetical protein
VDCFFSSVSTTIGKEFEKQKKKQKQISLPHSFSSSPTSSSTQIIIFSYSSFKYILTSSSNPGRGYLIHHIFQKYLTKETK